MPGLQDRLDALTHKLLHKQLGQVQVNAADIIGGTVGGAVLVPAENIVPGTFGTNAGAGNYTVLNRKLTIDGNIVDNFTVQGTGATIRLGARDGSDFNVLYRTGTVLKMWQSVNSQDRFHFEDGGRSRHGVNIVGEAIVGPWVADGNYAMFGSTARATANGSHYGMIVTAGDNNVYLSGSDLWLRLANNGQTMAVLKSEPSIEFWVAQGGMKHKFWSDGEYWGNSIGLNGDNGYNAGLVITGGGWIRHMTADIGWHNEARGAGMMGASTFGNQTCTTNNNETTIIARKISQAGWATAGLASFAESSSAVPYISMHANGCCTTNWRKDSGASYVVDVNSGGGCDWVYAANHPICSERARKHNISVAEEYGLKTIRGLKPHKFQYTPTDELEIFSWEKWKYDRAIGIWTVPPSEHMGWDDWHVGYFAEEMVNLVPEIVGLHPDGTPKGIDYGNLVVVAIAAINELADKVEDLEAQLYAR